MSKNPLKFMFNKKGNLVISGDNKGKYYITKVTQTDKDGNKVRTNVSANRENFNVSHLIADKSKINIIVKTNKPVADTYAETRYYNLLADVKTKKLKAISNKKSGYVATATWEESLWTKEDEIDNKIYNELIGFYLINAPGISKEGKKSNMSSRKSINIYDIWGADCFARRQLKNEYLKHQDNKIAGLYDGKIAFASNAKDMKEKLEARDLYNLAKDSLVSFDLKPRIAMTDSKENQFISFLTHIRNAFAHGSFLFYKGHFIFQDQNDKKVTGRGVIKIETLLFLKKLILKELD